ncbi:ABC transporter ATP-binding protein [Neorhizobium alkalisoli]|nr:ATP-binding cassette domain-containing protein [Neorhizobium alkalisoli]
MHKLVLRSVTKSYTKGTTVLKPFDLVAQSGELIVLVGPSGCGKSTLLKLIAGLEKLDDGQILLGDRDITDAEPRQRKIAMVFQNYALYPHLTVRENLAYPLRRQKLRMPAITEKVAMVARQLRLEELLDRRPSQLSGGQKQRVAMGRAIIREPDLFLLDEPLSNLDAALRTHVRGEIRDLQRRLGTTMIYVTHDQVEAQTLADRVVILRDGEVQQIGPPQEIYARPANIFAAAFLGAAPPNFLAGRVINGRIDVGQASLPFSDLPGECRTALAGREQVYLGLRPELLRAADDHYGDHLVLHGAVSSREIVGNTQNVYFRTDTACADMTRLSALAGRYLTDELVWTTENSNTGDTVKLAIRPEDILFFDAEGQAIGTHGSDTL